MVANGCFLDEAFGEIKTQETYSKVKKKKKKRVLLNLIETTIILQNKLKDI